MTDIPGRLRALAGIHPHLNGDARDLLNEAADKIDAMSNAGILARIDRLEAAVLELNPGLNWP